MKVIISASILVICILIFNFCVEDIPLCNSVNISRNSGSSTYPAIGADTNDNLHLVWYDITFGNNDIFYSRSTDNGSTWSTPINISNNSGESMCPTIAVDSRGNLTVAWRDSFQGSTMILYSRSIDNGTTWSSPRLVSNISGSTYHPTIISDSDCNIFLAWDDYDQVANSIIICSRLLDTGSVWIPQRNVSKDSGSSFHPSITVDSNDNLNLVWYVYTSSGYELFFSRSTDHGSSWSLPNNISTNSASSGYPAIAVDSTGSLFVTWKEFTPGNLEIFFSRSSDNGSTWTLPVNISNSPGLSDNPTVVVDNSDRPIVAWHESVLGNYEIFYSHSTDNGTTWSTPINISNNSGTSQYPTIIVDRTGYLNVAWSDYTPGNNEIFYCRIKLSE